MIMLQGVASCALLPQGLLLSGVAGFAQGMCYTDVRVLHPRRFFEAMEKVLGVAKCSDDVDPDGGTPAKLNSRSDSTGVDDAGGGGNGAAADGQRGVSLLYDRAADDVGPDADGELTAREAEVAAAAAVDGGSPSYDDEVDDVDGEDPSSLHVEQLFGPLARRLEAGQLVGELPSASLARGAQRPRRSHSAIAGGLPSSHSYRPSRARPESHRGLKDGTCDGLGWCNAHRCLLPCWLCNLRVR